jgi:hypothetical protein
LKLIIMTHNGSVLKIGGALKKLSK